MSAVKLLLKNKDAKIARLRVAMFSITDMEGQEGMSDHFFVAWALAVAGDVLDD